MKRAILAIAAEDQVELMFQQDAEDSRRQPLYLPPLRIEEGRVYPREVHKRIGELLTELTRRGAGKVG
jgi:hypothetical protein